MQHASDPHKYSASGLRYPTILFKTSLIGLMIFNPKKNPLAQATVPYDNLVSHLRIIYYFIGTNFVQSLISRQEVVVTALAKMAFTEHPPKSLVNFICRV